MANNMLTVKVEATPGAHILDAFKEAIELANKLNCYVDFKFNDVHCIASPGGSAENGETAYHNTIESEFKYKIAIS